MKTIASIMALALFAAIPASAPAGETLLRFKARNGEEFHCTVAYDFEMKGVGYSMKVKSSTVYGFKCESDSAPFELRAVIVRETFSMDMDIPFVGKIKGAIDTAAEKPAPPKNPMDFGKMVPYGLHVLHAARVGKPFTLVVDERGVILKAKGVQALLDRAAETIDADGLINPMMGQNLKQELTQTAFMEGVEALFMTLPEAPVKPGGSWSREFDRVMRDKSTLKLSEKTTLAETDGGVAAFTGVATLVKEGQEIKPEPPPMTTIHSARADKYRSDVEGVLDTATGRLVYSVTLIEFAATMSVQNPMENKPREAKQTFKAEITVEHAAGPPPK